jgi:hypothetical protein
MDNLNRLFLEVGKFRDELKEKDEFNLLKSIGFHQHETFHSKFIASLLNPETNHKKKTQFLSLFLEQIGIQDFSLEGVKILTENNAVRRRIDILIETKGRDIIIENKVWHQDGEKQLEDYYKSRNKIKENVDVIYLTLDGHEPSKFSLGDTLKVEDVKCISYKRNIIPWIEKCIEISRDNEKLELSLKMYLEIVNQLTQNNKYMNEILEYLRKNPDQIKLAVDIKKALEGKNLFIAFPEYREYLKDRLIESFDSYVADPIWYPEADQSKEENSMITIEEPNNGFFFSLYFKDGDRLYIENFMEGNHDSPIDLCSNSDLNDEILRAIIEKDDEKVDNYLAKKFEEIKIKWEN